MITKRAKCEFLTPCFCTGADAGRAEVRAASVRGQLRWWFRVLGGTPELEKSVFGGVHNTTAASKVVVRARLLEKAKCDTRDLPGQNKELYYLFHFARVSGKVYGQSDGPRWQEEGWFAPKTTFEVSVSIRRALTDAEEELFWQAWSSFLLLGGLGLRQTRGLGAFRVVEAEDFSLDTVDSICEHLQALRKLGIDSWIVTEGGAPGFTESWKECLKFLEATLGHIRQNGFAAKSGTPTPLGLDKPRQASALHLRPIQINEGFLPVIFLAPMALASASSARVEELRKLLDGSPVIHCPYKQKAPKPEDRDAISLGKPGLLR